LAALKETAQERNYKTVGGRKPPRRQPRSRFLARIRNYLLAGVLVTAPIGITVWLTLWFLNFVDARVMPLVPARWNPETYLPFSVPGLGLLLVLLVLILVGMMTAGMVGKAIRAQGARLMARVPVLRSIYSATEQIFETVLTRETNAFKEVALVEYPRYGSWSLGFVAGTTVGEVQELTGPTVINVFVPTTPNPTTGYLLFLPEHEVHRLPITVEQGLRLVISGGIVMPDRPAELEPTADEATRVAAAEAFVERQLKELREAPPAPRKRSPFLARLRNYLVTGVLITAPIFITVWLGWQIFEFFDQSVKPLIPPSWNPESYLPFGLPGLGILLLLIFLLLMGMFVAGYLGRWAIASGERLLQRVPFIRGVYKAMKQVFETLLAQQSKAFREVVLIEYPRSNSYSLGFVTGAGSDLIEGGAKRELINVFVATTPNPTSGFLLFVPPEEAIVLHMTVEQAIKMVVSGGLITPENPKGPVAPVPAFGDAATPPPP
jgi:uncharacterized membrane protein